MSITRKLLKGMGLTDEQQETILEAHTETVSEIKAERDRYKEDAEKLPDVQKQLDALKESAGKDGFEAKYNQVKKEFDDYKAAQTAKASHDAKDAAYRALLKEAGISDKRIDTVMRVTDVDSVELDDKGAIKDAADISKSIKNEWADFIVSTTATGANTSTPPANNNVGGVMTKEEIFKIKDPVARQNAIADNIGLFQKEG